MVEFRQVDLHTFDIEDQTGQVGSIFFDTEDTTWWWLPKNDIMFSPQDMAQVALKMYELSTAPVEFNQEEPQF